MFWYAIPICQNPEDADDYRFTDDRGMVVVAIKILRIKAKDIKLVTKPL